jgi:hypothetical protein
MIEENSNENYIHNLINEEKEFWKFSINQSEDFLEEDWDKENSYNSGLFYINNKNSNSNGKSSSSSSG